MENDTYCIYISRVVDESAVGLSIDGWEIKVIHKNELPDDKPPISNLYNRLKFFLSNINDMIFNYTDSNEQNPKYIYLIKQTINPNDVKPVMDTLRLFKKSQIGTTYPIRISENGASLIQRPYDYLSYEFDDEIPKFSLTPQEKNDIEELYQKIKTFYSLQQRDSKNNTLNQIKNMLDFFHEAYRTVNQEIAFTMRVIILEMLIDDDKKIKENLSKKVAFLLGLNEDRSKEIYNKCRELYKARSEYLHDGKTEKITPEFKLLALDYSRRVIANLIDIVYEKQIDIKAIREALNEAGFGDNPFNVKF